MPGKSSNIGQFWQELKRRRVIHVITVYATAAFVIIELVNNLAEPLNLPGRLPTIVIVVLAIGFPLAIILSWLYDLTSEGVERTKPLSETQEGEKPAVPNAWKIATYVSFVVIVGLVALNIVGGTKQLRAGDIQSLVILPFDNFTGDEELEYFVSGMHASLIGDVGKIGGLRVISRTSSNIYKGMDISISDIASELKVDAVVETAVMCLGDSICVQFRLVSTSGNEEQLWTADYMEEKSQILNLYNQVTRQIADKVKIELTSNEERLLSKTQTVDKEAYDAYLRSYAYWGDLSTDALDNAFEYLNLAIEKDPSWAPLYAGMALVWGGKLQMGMVETKLGRQKIHENINKAFELDPDFADSHFIHGIISTWTDWNWETGEKEFLKALAINPSDAMSRIYYAHLLMILQRTDEAITQGKLAVDLDPLNPLVLALYSAVLKGAGDFQTSFNIIEKALSIDPEHQFAQGQLERAYYNLGEYDEAIETFKKGLSYVFSEEVILSLDSIYNEQGRIAAYKEIIRLSKLYAQENYTKPGNLAQLYCRTEQYSKALDELEKGCEAREPNMPYIATNRPGFIELYDSTRFIAILEKMNLPLPKD